MAESSTPKTSKGLSGWIKAAIASVVSALGGAVLMYASPLLDIVIKPAKPIANFQAQVSGLNVTFQNKTTGGQEGWWDFGDGSALEPFDPDQPAVTHSYAKTGTYNVKLLVKNLLLEENNRTVPVVIDGGNAALPTIEAFSVIPVGGDYAPAAFRIESKVAAADLCVWAFDDRPIEITKDSPNARQERYITLSEPGTHVLKLAAFNGKQAVEKTQTVVVKQAPVGMVTATVAVTYEAVGVENKTTTPAAQFRFPMEQKAGTFVDRRPFPADPGFAIVKADLAHAVKDPNVKAAKVEIDAGRQHAIVTCELIRPSGKAPPPASVVQVRLEQQRLSAPTLKILDPVSVNLAVPGATPVPLAPLPPGWAAKNRKITLALQQDGKKLQFKENELPRNAPIQLPSGAACIVSAVEQNGQLVVEISLGKGSWSFFGD